MASASNIPTITIVVDDEALRDSLHLLLECEGFAIREFASAAQILADDSDDFETPRGGCLILDLKEPEKALLDRLWNRFGQMPTIIVMDSSADPEAARRRFPPPPGPGRIILLDKPGGYQGIGGLVRSAMARL